jgi:hypothetical protein
LRKPYGRCGRSSDTSQYTPLGRRGRKNQLGLLRDLFPLGLEAADRLIGIEAECDRIGPHETHRIGGSRQVLEIAALDRVDEGRFDAQRVCHPLDLIAEAFAGLSQLCPDTGVAGAGARETVLRSAQIVWNRAFGSLKGCHSLSFRAAAPGSRETHNHRRPG